jgi:hypothetical protein
MAKIEVEGAVYTGTPPALPALGQVNQRLRVRTGANFADALAVAYKVARRHHAPERWSQIVVLTDEDSGGLPATTSELLHEGRTSLSGRGIRWSIVGFGGEAGLRPLAIAGKGSYFTALTRQDMTRIFRERWPAIFGPVARNIRFRLDFPWAMEHTSAARGAREPVKATDFPYDEEHVMFESFRAPVWRDVTGERFTLTISYDDPESGQRVAHATTHPVRDLLGQNTTILRVAEVIHLFVEVIAEMMSAEEAGEMLDAYPDAPEVPLFQEYVELIRSQEYEEITGSQP